MSIENYYLPQSLAEAVNLLADCEDSLLVMGGGTIVMPLVNQGVSVPERVMGLAQSGLDYIYQSNGRVDIGATTTMSQMLAFDSIPMLQEAAKNTAAWSIRNMATVGGNLFAPPPAGDFAVALLALDAKIKLVSHMNERLVPLSDFYTGFLSNVVEPLELVAEIQVEAPLGKTAFLKFGRKQANTPAVVTVAAHLVMDGEVVQEARLALGAVGPHPMRVARAEAALEGAPLNKLSIVSAATLASEDCHPATDAIASEWYRREMVKVMVSRCLGKIEEEGRA